MRLTKTGTIEVDGCKVRTTKKGQWQVSRSGIHIGYADTLAEGPILIARQRDAVRERLARLNAEAKARAEAEAKAEAEERALIDSATKPE